MKTKKYLNGKIMDYKEKYNKLVEAVKVLQEENPSDEGIQNWVNDNVPELRESEDERIRKYLIYCVTRTIPEADAFNEISKEQILAWLEKLKVFAEHGDGLYYFANSEFTYVGNPAWDNASFLEKHGEQKSFDYENATIVQKDFAPKVEQKPADEKMIGKIRSIIEKYAISQSAVDVNGDLCEKEYIDADNWLKFLKQRYTWEPSDEQMRALHDMNLTGNISYTGQGQTLIELYNDLKKL